MSNITIKPLHECQRPGCKNAAQHSVAYDEFARGERIEMFRIEVCDRDIEWGKSQAQEFADTVKLYLTDEEE